MQILNLLRFGPLDYMLIDALQRRLNREVGTLNHPDTLIAWEAKDVYTAGRRTKPEDIPNNTIPVIQMDRGGSVTYHGPGQLVLYPIIKVKTPHDTVRFVRNTEQAIINALRPFNINGVQVAGRSGVWIQKEAVQDEKICAIGIKFAKETSMHGMALNVNTDLQKFTEVIPCGIFDAGVTSMQAQNVHTTLQVMLKKMSHELNQAYREFILPERFSSQLNEISPLPYLDAARTDLKESELPAKTGTLWKPNPKEEQ